MNSSGKKIFLVASRGLTASTWFCNALNQHEDIYCSHGRDLPGRLIVTDELFVDRSYRISRLEHEQWQRKASIDEYLTCLFNHDNSRTKKIIGNIHGYILPELLDKIQYSRFRQDIAISNMTRNPLALVESYTALVVHNYTKFYEKYELEHLPRTKQNVLIFEKLGLEVCPDIELQGFVEGCQTVVKMAKDIDISDVLVIPMERIVTDMDYFSYIAKKLTGDMCYFSEELLTRIFNIGNINSHQKQLKKIRKDLNREVLKTPELVWASWKGLKQEIFHAMVGKKELVKFEALGYDFSFL